jgi:hypothetical protein
MLQLITYMNEDEIELEKLRIWDFYLTFPGEVSKIVFPNNLKDLKKVFKDKIKNPYENLIDPKRLFNRMRSYQIASLKSLASYGFIETEALNKNLVLRTKKEVPNELIPFIQDISVEKSNIIKLVTGFSDFPLLGPFGLKARTGLLQYKYDPK